jgi:hypothetical protein
MLNRTIARRPNPTITLLPNQNLTIIRSIPNLSDILKLPLRPALPLICQASGANRRRPRQIELHSPYLSLMLRLLTLTRIPPSFTPRTRQASPNGLLPNSSGWRRWETTLAYPVITSMLPKVRQDLIRSFCFICSSMTIHAVCSGILISYPNIQQNVTHTGAAMTPWDSPIQQFILVPSSPTRCKSPDLKTSFNDRTSTYIMPSGWLHFEWPSHPVRKSQYRDAVRLGSRRAPHCKDPNQS